MIGKLLLMFFSLMIPFFSSIEKDEDRHLSNTFLHNTCSIQNNTFVTGEELTYVIYYNWNFVWIPAGEVEFIVEEDGPNYHFIAQGQTYDSYEWFYVVDDRYECYANKEDLTPVKAIREVHEGNYHKYSEAEFDRENGLVHYTSGKDKSSAHEEKKIEMQECIQNVLSTLYLARNIDYENTEKGAVFPVDLFMDDKNYDIQFTYEGKKKKKIKRLGKYHTIELVPELIEGNAFKDDAQMRVWATDDANRLPLLIESPVSVGSIKAVLKSAKNLKYPITARVK